MKKKYRDIVVGGKKYAWQCYEVDGILFLKIWLDKKVIYDKDVAQYLSDSIGIDTFDAQLKPKTVARIIIKEQLL
jgi:hypothetical protein